MEKFEFYGAPDLEREMNEALSPLQKRKATMFKQGLRKKDAVQAKAQAKSFGKGLQPGEKMVFGKKVKTESATAGLRAELDERIKVIGISGRDKKKPIKPGPMKGGSVKKGCSCEGLKDELAELYPHLAE